MGNATDNQSFIQGALSDVEMFFDGSDWIFNSKNVTAADEIHFTNFDNYVFDNNIILPKATNKGIKIDTTTPTFGFRDILGDQFSKNTGATKPTLTTYNGVINSWLFGVGD